MEAKLVRFYSKERIIMKVIITEKQNLQSLRTGEIVEVTTLTAAKRAATKNQAFYGTVLTIESESGSMLAYKEDGKSWVNC